MKELIEFKFHVKLPRILAESLNRAKENGLNKTDVLKNALIEYLKKNKF